MKLQGALLEVFETSIRYVSGRFRKLEVFTVPSVMREIILQKARRRQEQSRKRWRHL